MLSQVENIKKINLISKFQKKESTAICLNKKLRIKHTHTHTPKNQKKELI